jgi:hypothetical protein
MQRRIFLKAAFLFLGLSVLPIAASAQEARTVSASAEFLINPTGCRETHVLVSVSETSGQDPLVDFIYNVQSTCQDPGDFLFYHSISGNAQVHPRDFSVNRSLKTATLNTIIPVFDDEGGVVFEMKIKVKWKRMGPANGDTQPAIASLTVDTPFDSPYITDEIRRSTSASLSQSR